MSYPEIIHHGAVKDVTGSCHQLCMDESSSLLVDCGAIQGRGPDDRETLFGFNPVDIKAIIITHVHHDHVGRLSAVLAAGYKGPILCSEPSAQLLPLIIEDSLKFELKIDPEQASDYLHRVKNRIIALPFAHWFTLIDTDALICKVRLQRAGHILGSAYVECDVQYPSTGRSRRVVFSGDLGASHAPMLSSPKSPERADVLVLESTYGNRRHQDRVARQSRLERIIDKALADRGTVLIPAFSVGRTQELLYELEDILQRKALTETQQKIPESAVAQVSTVDWPQLPIILDSPLASRITKVYQAFAEDWDTQGQERIKAGRRPLGFRQLITIDSHAQHLQTLNYLASTLRPAIVIAGHGMCAGGRIVNYLKAMLGDARHNVIFVGYQVKGTPGAAIQAHEPGKGRVELDGLWFDIHAEIATATGYSAHADQQGLVDFVTGMGEWPTEVRLVHGETQAKKALGKLLKERYWLKQRKLNLVIPV